MQMNANFDTVCKLSLNTGTNVGVFVCLILERDESIYVFVHLEIVVK